MYLPEPVRAVQAMLDQLRPGGRLMIQNHDGSYVPNSVPLPLNESVNALIWDTVAAGGGDTALGLKLHGILSEAGAKEITIASETVVQTATQYAPTAMLLDLMSDRIIANGTAARAELDALNLTTLDVRLADERRQAGASFTAETIFGAIALKP